MYKDMIKEAPTTLLKSINDMSKEITEVSADDVDKT